MMVEGAMLERAGSGRRYLGVAAPAAAVPLHRLG
jgi:hypothetical protein